MGLSEELVEDADGIHWFWSPKFWLPPGVTWKDLKTPDEGTPKYPRFEDLLCPIPLAIGLIFLRYCLERLVLQPIGRHYGLKSRKGNFVVPNELLESAYRAHGGKKVKLIDVVALAKRTDMETRQVERWLRKRSAQDKPTTLAKFCESGWRFFYYVSSIIIGFAVLRDKSWFWDIRYCWYDYPKHEIEPGIWFHYMISSAFYYSLLFSQFSDAHRKDFWQMFIHHITTIFLLAFSWTINFVRIGTLVLLVHDSADPFLEIAKMAKYANFNRLCWVLFGTFSFMFFLTRLYVYPFYVLRSAVYDALELIPVWPAQFIFYVMLFLLLALHMFWSYLLFKAIYKAAFDKEISDVRSSSESASCDSDDEDSFKDEVEENGNKKDGEVAAGDNHHNNTAIRKTPLVDSKEGSEKLISNNSNSNLVKLSKS